MPLAAPTVFANQDGIAEMDWAQILKPFECCRPSATNNRHRDFKKIDEIIKLAQLGWGTAADPFAGVEMPDSEESCAFLLYAAKWPRGFRCPACNCPHAYRINTRRLPLYECAHCRHQTSLTAGTIFEKSRTPLSKWFLALLLFATVGINATKLQEILGTTYKTAWLMLAKIRYAVSRADSRTLLTGIVKLQISRYGMIRSIRRMSDPSYPIQEYPLLVGASMNSDGTPREIKVKIVPESELVNGGYRSFGSISLFSQRCFAARHIDSRASEIQFYRSYRLRSHDLYLVGLHTKDEIVRIYRGIGYKHLQAYIDERCFRLNTKLNGGSAARQLLDICVSSKPITCSDIVTKRAIMPEAA
jgi:transposase-like protein